ncbi:MAG: glutathione S-transferase N-terminal domain-containing protein [Chromatiales bacterium]|jgi:glutaredoxin
MWHRLFDLLGFKREGKRSPTRQREVDEASRGLALYHLEVCPYCVRVKRAIKRLDLQIELRDAHLPAYQQELRLQGGRFQTPCLRIGETDDGYKAQWLYESADIIRYLEQRFPKA